MGRGVGGFERFLPGDFVELGLELAGGEEEADEVAAGERGASCGLGGHLRGISSKLGSTNDESNLNDE